ncbi:MAG: alpha/beta fold hydrolase [Pseudomonadota bacterium]
MLNSIIHGQSSTITPVLIAHGLYGSARNWGAIAKRLSSDRTVTAVDMRNHGESPWYNRHGYEDMAADLAAVLETPHDVVGHSMGGKAVMALALTEPDRVRRLVVADIAPVTYDHTQMPMIEAMRGVDLSQIVTRRDADEQLATAIDDASVRAFLLQSLDVQAKRWRLNLDVLADEMPKIIGFPTVNGQFEGPALFLSGAESDYVMPEHRAAIKNLFPKARFAKIPGAGHWLHADQPRAFEAALLAFLDADI